MLDAINMKKDYPNGFDPDMYYSNPAGFGPEDDRQSISSKASQLRPGAAFKGAIDDDAVSRISVQTPKTMVS